MAKSKGGMTVGEAGRKGGKSTLKKYGPKHYSKIGKKGGSTPNKPKYIEEPRD